MQFPILDFGLVHSGSEVASFPGPAQLSVAISTVLQATKSWAGPGNEASSEAFIYRYSACLNFLLFVLQMNCIILDTTRVCRT